MVAADELGIMKIMLALTLGILLGIQNTLSPDTSGERARVRGNKQAGTIANYLENL